MRLPNRFDPIAVGDFDNFAFEFTAEVGAASITSTTWRCTLDDYSGASDPSPSARVISTSIASQIQYRAMDGSLQTRTGFFSIALIGGMPPSAAGGTYVLEASVTLSDGRVLSLSSTVLCSAALGL